MPVSPGRGLQRGRAGGGALRDLAFDGGIEVDGVLPELLKFLPRESSLLCIHEPLEHVEVVVQLLCARAVQLRLPRPVQLAEWVVAERFVQCVGLRALRTVAVDLVEALQEGVAGGGPLAAGPQPSYERAGGNRLRRPPLPP